MSSIPDNADEIDAEIPAELDQIERDPDTNTRSAIWLNLKRDGVNGLASVAA